MRLGKYLNLKISQALESRLKLKHLKNPLNSILASQWQLALLVVAIVFAYWHSIFAGAPRSDHIGYLHQVGQYTLFSDILMAAPSFNRTDSAGDFLLYRPLLYVQLGLNYFFFGYDFARWQIMSLVLHVWLVARLFLLFPSKIRQHSPLPFLTCIVFATSAIASEQVLWNHITGYLLYLHLTLSSITCLQSYLSRNDTTSLTLSLLFALMAQFTHELGVLYSSLVAVFLLWENIGRYWRQMVLYFACALSYPAISFYDLFRLGIWPTHETEQSASIASSLLEIFAKLPEIIGLALFQLFFWFGSIFFPQVLNLTVDGRTRIDGLRLGEWLPEKLNWLPDLLGYGHAELVPFFYFDTHGTYLLVLNFVLAAFTLFIALKQIMMLRATNKQPESNARNRLAIVPILVMTAYALLIAFGRTEPRGIQTLGNNLYYAYTAHFFLLVGCILAFPRETQKSPKLLTIGNRRLLALMLVTLCALNVAEVSKLTQQMRYEYSEPRQALISEISAEIAAYGPDQHFVFSIENDCEVSQNLDWLKDGHIRRNTDWQPPFTYLDALFPEYSADVMINSGKLTETVRILRLDCPK